MLHQDLDVRVFVLQQTFSSSGGPLSRPTYINKLLESALHQLIKRNFCCAQVLALNPTIGNRLNDILEVLSRVAWKDIS